MDMKGPLRRRVIRIGPDFHDLFIVASFQPIITRFIRCLIGVTHVELRGSKGDADIHFGTVANDLVAEIFGLMRGAGRME